MCDILVMSVSADDLAQWSSSLIPVYMQVGNSSVETRNELPLQAVNP